MHTHETRAYGICAREMHETRAHEMHVREMHAYEILYINDNLS